MINNAVKKYLLIIVGTISLVLGIIGTAVPLLPTTPFLLLASFCYVRSSDRLYKWLTNHPVFGTYITNYLVHKGITRKTRIVGLVTLWLSLGISIFLVEKLFLKIMLVIIGLGVTAHIVSLRTIPSESEQRGRVS